MLSFVMLSVVMLSVVMLRVVMLNVFILNVVAPRMTILCLLGLRLKTFTGVISGKLAHLSPPPTSTAE